MIKRKRKQLIQFYIVSDILAIILSFNLAFHLRFQSGWMSAPKGIPDYQKYLILVPFLVMAHVIHFSYQGYYKVKLRRNRLDDLFLVLLNTVVTAFIMLLIFSYLKSYRFIDYEVSHKYLMVYVPCAIFLIFCMRLLIFKAFRRTLLKKNGMSRVLIAGTGDLAQMTAEKLRKYAHFGIEITGFLERGPKKDLPILGDFEDLEKVVLKHHITDLVIALSSKEYESTMKMIETANNLLIEIRLVPDILQIASLRAGMEHIEGIPVINLGDIPLQGWQLLFKRAFDLTSAFFGLLLVSPVMLLVGLLVKLTSRGPVFYRQTRIGLDGKHFKMIKFRTMVTDAEKETGAIWSPPGDARVTPVGRFLRKFSIDELPQLFNVLMGHMSLVGPRPERPELVERFKGDIPKYMLRHSVKTGMTGWAQVHGLRGNTSLEKRIEFDIYYIQNWSFRLDLEILWRTLLKFQFIDPGT
ncbi:MAG: undecaprenyl-phosphate glucose phosphotransferase [bacterium]|nr:undecaprenyl-phosphate glucose phosphotransferase [bacterium]